MKTSDRLMTAEREAVFWSRAERDGECLVWTRGKTGVGYGMFRINGRNVASHRIAYILTHGQIPTGLVVRHTCDRPLCIEPSHLVSGTHLDNVRDMHDRGRARKSRGSDHFRSKLTEGDVVLLRTMRASGSSLDDLAAKFGIHRVHLCGICTGRHWRHAGGPIHREQRAV